jgi:cytochrome c-type biogenesis protein CcmH
MMNDSTNWLSAVAILGSGLILGALFVFFFSRRRSALINSNLELQDLEAKRDALVLQLRAPEISIEERERLERETAEVLRALDRFGGAAPAAGAGRRPAAEATAAPLMNPAIKGFLWGAGAMAALAALGYFVMQSATPRQEGESPTGGGPMVSQSEQRQPQQAAQANPMVAQLEQAVKNDPDNLNLRNDLAQAYLESDNLMAVFEQTKFVLTKAPNDSRALTFQALVRMAMGEVDTAISMLQQATKSDPKNLDSWVALAWIYAQSDRMPDAEAAIAEATRVAPNEKEQLEAILQQMRARVAGGGGAPQQAQQLPPDHPPLAAPVTPPAAPPSAASGSSVRVTLDLDPAARARQGTLFIIARGAGGGPPVAVKRVASPSFPLTVDLSAADSMMGQPLPERLRLEARLDTDGDPMTRPATDPASPATEVTLGASVRLALK